MEMIFQESLSNIKLEEKPKSGKFEFKKELSNRMVKDFELRQKLDKTLEPTYSELRQYRSNLELINYLNELIVKFEEYLKHPETGQIMNEQTFPLILLNGLNILCDKFNSKQEALNIIELLKKKSVKVYFYGLTIDILNLNLKLNWKLFKDLNKINLIIDEIKINGIKSNISTLKLLRLISNESKQFTNYNKQDEMELFKIEQYVSDLVETLQ